MKTNKTQKAGKNGGVSSKAVVKTAKAKPAKTPEPTLKEAHSLAKSALESHGRLAQAHSELKGRVYNHDTALAMVDGVLKEHGTSIEELKALQGSMVAVEAAVGKVESNLGTLTKVVHGPETDYNTVGYRIRKAERKQSKNSDATACVVSGGGLFVVGLFGLASSLGWFGIGTVIVGAVLMATGVIIDLTTLDYLTK